MNSSAPLAKTGRAPARRKGAHRPSAPKAESRPASPDTLKIIVVGTPKTGNTWVKHLLAEVYGLTPVRLGPEFDPAEAEAAGPRWISHQHYLPHHDLLAWGAAHDAVFVSAVRHPGDVLVSLWHHMQSRRERGAESQDDLNQTASMLLDSVDVADDSTLSFVERGFDFYLNLSIAWLGLPGVRSVRYEDLWECPVEALRALTAGILPVSDERLRLALCTCELRVMQALLDPEKKLVRKGGTGGWRTILSPEVKRRLARLDPYPAQFAALGYTMDEDDPANTPHPTPTPVVGPFGADHTFVDGTPVVPVLMRAYHDQPSARRETWPDPRAVGEPSFFAWLNRPTAADPRAGAAAPAITELAYYLYSIRSDLREIFPEVFGAHRTGFYEWFLANARQEYRLAEAFFPAPPFPPDAAFDDGTPVAQLLIQAWFDLPPALRERWPCPRRTGPDSFFSWLNSPAAADPSAGEHLVVVSELAAYLYSVRPDIATAYPDLYGRDRAGYVEWFVVNARREYGLADAFVRLDPFAGLTTFSDGTRTARVLVRAYLELPESMRTRWPCPTQAGEGSFLAWLNSPAAADPTRGALAPAITELGAYVHSIRSDLRARFPDLYGTDRTGFTKWFLASGVREYDLDRAFTLPVVRSWAEAADRVPPHIRQLVRQRARREPAAHSAASMPPSR